MRNFKDFWHPPGHAGPDLQGPRAAGGVLRPIWSAIADIARREFNDRLKVAKVTTGRWHTGTNLSYGFLTPRDNLVFGIHREIRIDKDKDVLRGVNIYAITTRVAVAFENEDAVVAVVNLAKS